ncbi:hypothetical protein ACFXPA_27620 [Amycolatopsis sp. NPDC059090]|uniref:hypothetical protein n=1 Tax=Amycolatopsis sp. NPDC059090 TaxID=3346723 RepID=UPI00366FE4FA
MPDQRAADATTHRFGDRPIGTAAQHVADARNRLAGIPVHNDTPALLARSQMPCPIPNSDNTCPPRPSSIMIVADEADDMPGA